LTDRAGGNSQNSHGTSTGSKTLGAVARLANVDTSTVSRVLRDDPVVRVRPATRERIIAAAAKLGYVPNVNARSLVLRRTMTLGLIIPSAANVVYDQIIKGAESAARAAGYVLLLTESSDFGEIGTAYRELVLGGRVDGLLIGSGNLNDSLPDVVFEHSGNCVVLNRLIRGPIPSVIEDDERGMGTAVEHLAQLGHTRIACLAGPPDVDTATRRLAGFKAAMRALGLPVARGYVQRAPFNEAGGFEAMTALLNLPTAPTAVAVSSLPAAIGALAACHELDVDIPADVSVIAFHDAKIAEFLSPPLATILMPLFELGEAATQLLVRVINGKDFTPLQRVQTPEPRVIARKSLAPPRPAHRRPGGGA
jgi:LacI family transcriptional regulator, galactose operon repressor